MKKLLLLVTCAAFMAACDFPGSDITLITGPAAGSSSGGSTPTPTPTPSKPGLVSYIPSDDLAGEAPTVTTPISLGSFLVEGLKVEGHRVARATFTGIPDGNDSFLDLFGTEDSEQNVWITVDDVDKGIHVASVSEEDVPDVKTDIVFLVDNSGSMSEEAEGVAHDITLWAELLSKSLDVQFGCVGYGYHVEAQYPTPTPMYGIAGAMDLADYSVLDDFLNNRGESGVRRTLGYHGPRAAELENYANTDAEEWTVCGGECGVQAFKFADKYFNFRKDANRVYVNFTDDANYPGGDEQWSIESIRKTWKISDGTIHTVFSNDTAGYQSILEVNNIERSWNLSEITGGSTICVNSDFSGVTLSSLPVSGALLHTYTIEFTNIDSLLDGADHTLVITIYSSDGTIQGIFTVSINFSDLFKA